MFFFVLGWRQLKDFSNEDGYGHVTMSQSCTVEGPSNFMNSELCIHMWPFVAGGQPGSTAKVWHFFPAAPLFPMRCHGLPHATRRVLPGACGLALQSADAQSVCRALCCSAQAAEKQDAI